MLTEKECREALKILSTQPDESFCNGSICRVSDCGYCPKNTASKLLKHLIDDHFANPALKLDELEEGMVIWDNKENTWIEIYSVHEYEGGDEDENYDYEIFYDKFGWECLGRLVYEPNRFYRKEVINHDN